MTIMAAHRVTPAQARTERLRRERARRSFLAFAQYVMPGFLAPAHIRLLAGYLQQVMMYVASGGAKGVGRLMILMPPRHGKSELASRLFPAWMLGRMPDARIILTSYAADLAAKNSRAVREIVTGQAYQALFGTLARRGEPVLLSSDSRSVQAWDLAAPHRGGVVATGVGGGITGLGAHLLVIDDPYKNREEAERQGQRDLVDDWYKSSAYTRLEPNGAVVLFHTRWHVDDLAGRLIKRMATEAGADRWEVVCLPALALEDYPRDEEQREKMRDGIYLPTEDPLERPAGAALWEARYPAALLENLRVNLGTYDFSALYQQVPYTRQGGFFRRDWFEIVESGPGREAAARVRYWDKAASPGGDYTAGALVSRDKDGMYYIEHVARGRWMTGERDKRMVAIGRQDYEQYGIFPIWHQQDPGSAGLDSARVTNAMLSDDGLQGHYEPVSGSKEVRASALQSAAQSGRVRIVRGAWVTAFLDEMAAFPRGRHDDQVDAAASALLKVFEMTKKHRESRIL